MNLEPNMYVRTKWGIARLIGECWKDFGGELAYAVDCCLQPIDETKIFKEDIIGEPSFNLIDLIEVGDYVNEERVEEKWKEVVLVGQECRPITPNDIKSIVTKQQFESMQYVID